MMDQPAPAKSRPPPASNAARLPGAPASAVAPARIPGAAVPDLLVPTGWGTPFPLRAVLTSRPQNRPAYLTVPSPISKTVRTVDGSVYRVNKKQNVTTPI